MFTSYYFVLFVIALWLIYAIVKKNQRKLVLLAFSYVFCGCISWTALAALVLSTLLIYFGAIILDRLGGFKLRRVILISIIVLFGGCLTLIKNIPYILSFTYFESIPQHDFFTTLVLPIGFSFYSFSALGYIVDVYKRREGAQRDFVSFALFMGFFVKFVSGPIERENSFSSQISKLETIAIFERERISYALSYIIWGYFLKMVIADRLGLIVDEIYNAIEAYDSVWLCGGAIFYSFQIYADFAGYTCIAIGCAMLFGIELSQNFKSPYCSLGISDFWRRWHITLSSWLRDYIYIPLGGNKKGMPRKCINILIVFVICGIWHGNGLTFVIWGLLHGLFSILESVLVKNKPREVILCAVSRLVTFAAVTLAWIFFRADTVRIALNYLSRMFTNGVRFTDSVAQFETSGYTLIQIVISIILIIGIYVIDRICYEKDCSFVDMMQESRYLRYAVCYVCLMAIFVIGIYGGDFSAERFIYMNF